jgi:hypothetical protein
VRYVFGEAMPKSASRAIVNGNSTVSRAKNGHLFGFHRLDRKNLGALYDFMVAVDSCSGRVLVAGYLVLSGADSYRRWSMLVINDRHSRLGACASSEEMSG